MGDHARDRASRKPRMPWRATSASPVPSPSTTAPGGPASHRRRRGVLLAGAAGAATLAVVAVTLPAAMAGPAGSHQPPQQRLGVAPHLPRGAVATKAPAGGTELDLGVLLAPRDPAALTSFITEVSTPGSPMYRHYLKTGQFAKSFGPSPATVTRVRAALKAKGLTAGPLEADGMTLPVHTTVGTAAKALDTHFTGYRDRNGKAGVTVTQAPALDADIAPAVTTITGLTTTATTVRPHHLRPAATAADGGTATTGSHTASRVAPHISGTTPSLCSTAKTKLYGSDTQNYWSPLALASAYGMAAEPNVGTGVSVGIFELEDYARADIAAYQSCLGTHVPVGTVTVDGGPTLAPSLSANIGVESALDIEDLIGLVPQASLVVYQGPDASDGRGGAGPATYQDILAVYQRMVDDNRVQVISSSWGGCEQDTPTPFMDAENKIFMQAAAQGQTVTSSAGDDGSGDCYGGGPNASALSVDDPASQPYVLGVGGTTMTGAGGTTQTVWNSGTGDQQGATGGGVSTYWSLDAATGYQAGITGPGYSDDRCGAATGMRCRQVPDVAALADPYTGYPVAVGGYWIPIGGTSGASPTWAALIAQADLDVSCRADGPVGFVNPTLYSLPASAFHDVTSGSNYIESTGVTPAGSYTAAAGYDLTTGLGTPHARSIIPALCKAAPQSPGTTFTALNPTRLLDTRYHVGVSTTTPVAANSLVTLQVTGQAGIPDGASAVVLNVTATASTASGYLTVYPGGATRPGSSNLNWPAGRTVPNLVTVPIGAHGTVGLYNHSSGTVHIIADTFGYFSTAATGTTYHPVGPARVLDTRSAVGVSTTTPVAANSGVSLAVAGAGGVPATGATAAVLNVTVTAPTASGYLTVYPGGADRPTASNLNWVPGQTVPNLVVVPIGPDGTVELYNHGSGTVHVVADVFGYYSADASGTTFHAAGPARMLDTRYGIGAPAPGPLTATGQLSLDLNDGNVLAHAKAVVLNVTVAGSTGAGVLTVWPDGQPRPTSSNLNWTKGQIIANLVTVPVVDGKVDFHVNYGSTDVIADLFGYYTD
jgi:hypothetical protein